MTAAIRDDEPEVRRTYAAAPSEWLLALLMPIGPLAVGVLRFLLPYHTTDHTSVMVTGVTNHPARESIALWLGTIGIYTLVPGVLAAARLSRRSAPRLTAWAMALVVPGYLSMAGLLYSDQVMWASGQHGVPAATAVALIDGAHPTVLLQMILFVVGHVVGTVLLGLALLRSRRIPTLVAWGLVVSQPLHFVAAMVLGSPPLDLLAWCLTAVAMGFAAGALLHDWRESKPALCVAQ